MRTNRLHQYRVAARTFLAAAVAVFFASACGDATAPDTDWGFGISGRWAGEMPSGSLVLDFGPVEKTCQPTSYGGGRSCSGVAEITGTLRKSSVQTTIRGAAWVGEGTDSPAAIYLIANNPVEQSLDGCAVDEYDYWAYPARGEMSGDVVSFCRSRGTQGNPSSRTQILRLRRQ